MTAQIERLSAELQRFVSALETVGLTKELLTTLSSSSRRNPQSLWGKISKLVYGNNRQTNRDKLYYKWVRNTRNIQSIALNSLASSTPVISSQSPVVEKSPVAGSQLPTEEIRAAPVVGALEVNVNLADILLDTRLSLFTKKAAETVREVVGCQSVVTCDKSSLRISCISLDKCMKELLDNDKFTIWASASLGTTVYNDLISMANEQFEDYEGEHKCLFLNNEAEIWCDAIRYYTFETFKTHRSFILLSPDHIYHCQHFTHELSALFEFKILKRSYLCDLWLILEKVECFGILQMFDSSYCAVASSVVDKFILWLEQLRDEHYNDEEFVSSLLSSASLKEIQSNNTATEVVNVCNSPEPACENVELVTSEIDCSLNTCSMDQSISHEVECADNTRSLYSDPNIVSETDLELHSSGEFFLSGIEWENNLLVINTAGIVKLSGDWTNYFSLKMSSIFPHCCLKFNYYKLNYNLGYINSNFFLARAECKFSNCFKFRFLIKNNPHSEARSISVSYEAYGCHSALHDDGSTSHSRHLSGTKRRQTAFIVNQDGVSNY